MLYLFISSTLFLVLVNYTDKIPKGLKYFFYIVYTIGIVIFFIHEVYRAIKR